MDCLLLLDGKLKLNWAGVLNLLDIQDVIVTQAINMDTLILIQVCTSDVSIDRHSIIFFIFLLSFNYIKSISNHI